MAVTLVLALTLTPYAGGAVAPPSPPTTARATAARASIGYVTRSGASFRVAGRRFRFVGFNLYDAAATARYSCNPSTRLDAAGLDAAMATVARAGGTVVRFWATQAYTAGGTDWSGVDRVIRSARAHGLRVLPVLEDGPGDCSTGPARVTLAQADGGHWYSRGYLHPYGSARLSYRAYARLIAHHYRRSRTVLGWMMVNEAETSERDRHGRTALVGFARRMARVLHHADHRHLVTLGTQANGAPGTSGPDFRAIYRLRGLDFSEVHDWAWYGADDQAMPGARADGSLPRADSAQCRALDARLACSFAINRHLHKPLVVGEAGIAVHDPASERTRAAELAAKASYAFRHGADGYLIWQLNVANTDGYAVIIGSDDPVIAMLRAQAARLR